MEGEKHSGRRTWDEAGREVLAVSNLDESGNWTEQRHDSQGRLTVRLTHIGSSRSTGVREERVDYDEAGRLVLRIRVEEWKDNLTGETVRLHYDAWGLLVLEEEVTQSKWRRIYRRDAAGNLLEARVEGTADDWLPVRVGYTYGCFD